MGCPGEVPPMEKVLWDTWPGRFPEGVEQRSSEGQGKLPARTLPPAAMYVDF